MTEPQGDHCDVDACVQQRHGGGVPESVRCHVLVSEGRAMLFGALLVNGDAAFNGVVAEAPAGAGGEQRLVRVVSSLLLPGTQHGGGGGCQRNAPLLAALAGAAHVSSCPKLDVAAVEPDQ